MHSSVRTFATVCGSTRVLHQALSCLPACFPVLVCAVFVCACLCVRASGRAQICTHAFDKYGCLCACVCVRVRACANRSVRKVLKPLTQPLSADSCCKRGCDLGGCVICKQRALRRETTRGQLAPTTRCHAHNRPQSGRNLCSALLWVMGRLFAVG